MWWRFKGTSTARGYKREPFLLEYDAQPSMQRSSETKETNVSFRENSSPLFLVWLKANRWRKIILRPTRKGNVPPRETETSLEGWMERNGNLNLPSTRPRILPLSLFVCASHSDWSFSHSPSVFFFPPLNSSPVLSHCEISVIFKWTLCSHGFQIRDEYQSRPLCPLENEFSWTRTWRGERKRREEEESEDVRWMTTEDDARRNLIFSPVKTSLFIPYFTLSPALPSVLVFGSLPRFTPPRLFGMHTERSLLLNAAVLLSPPLFKKEIFRRLVPLQDFVTCTVELSLSSYVPHNNVLNWQYYEEFSQVKWWD